MNQLSDDLAALAALGVPVHLSVGDRMKTYETKLEARLDPTRPIIARCDGRGFSKLTRGMQKPELRFNQMMMRTTQFLIEKTHAALGYTQSDEISIVFPPHSTEATVLFDGRIQKTVSVLAGLATVAFYRELSGSEELHPFSDQMPVFDCRVYQTPTEGEAVNALLWRVRDATKNATSMVAGTRFSANQLDGVSSSERRAMLREVGVDFETDFPDYFRNGSFWHRVTVERNFNEAEWLAIPAEHRPDRNQKVFRSEVRRIAMPDHIGFDDIAKTFINHN